MTIGFPESLVHPGDHLILIFFPAGSKLGHCLLGVSSGQEARSKQVEGSQGLEQQRGETMSPEGQDITIPDS